MISLKRRSIEVVLLESDDMNTAEELLAAVEAAAGSGVARLADAGASREASAAFDAFMEEAGERGITLTVLALPRKTYRGLIAEHPPREGDADDARWGLNVDTVGDALVPECVDMELFPSIADRDAFLDDLSDANWSRLVSACVKVNQAGGIDPKVRLSLRATPASGESSDSPARLA